MRRATSAIALAVAISAVAAAAGLLVRHSGRAVEHASIDWRYRLRGARPAGGRVVVVALDTKTGVELGIRLPPDRATQAAVVRRLTQAGAKVIAYDLALNGRTDPDADLAVVKALREAPAAVVATGDLYDHRTGTPGLLAGIATFSTAGVRPGNTERVRERAGSWLAFTPAIGQLDGFPTAAAAAFRGVRRIVPPPDALIDYPGPAGTVPRLSFVDVLRGRFSPAAIRGKVVVVGDTAPELQDQHDVPLGNRMAGPELQADAIATALDGFPLRRTSRAVDSATIGGLAATCPLLLLALAAVRRRRRRALPGGPAVVGVGVAVAAMWTIAAVVAFDHGVVVDFVPGLTASLVASGLSWGAASLAERARYRELRRRFAEHDEGLVRRVLSSEPSGDDYARLREFVPGFRIQSELGRGGMGIVYRATELSLGRDVALKLIRSDLALDDGYRARFLEEARNAARVEHPNLVPIYSTGEADEGLYIAMRLVDGEDLGGVLADSGRLDVYEAAALMHRVALALDALHVRQLVHCDVKPENILRAGEDPEHPYLTDFGIARALDAVPEAGQHAAGTWAYMAPEQFRSDEIGPAVDVYALGAVLFRLVTGTRPFPQEDRIELMYAHATAARPRASERVDGLPATLDDLIARAMAVEPPNRFPTASAFTQSVLDALERVPRPGSPPRPRAAARRIATEPM